MYLSGFGSTSIAQTLNSERIPNPYNYKKEKGVPFSPARLSTTRDRWSDDTIRSILKNEMYIGNMVQGKLKRISYKNKKLVRVPQKDWIIVENTHEPIISREDFIKARQRFGKYIRPQKDGALNPLAYKIKCLKCGGSFHKHKAKGHDYFRCRSNISDHGACVRHAIRADMLFEMVLAELNKMISAYKDDTFIDRNMKAVSVKEQKLNDLLEDRQNLERQITEKAGFIKELYLDKIKGIIEESQFMELNSAFVTEKDELNHRLSLLDKQIDGIKVHTYSTDEKNKIIKKYDCIEKLTREIADEFIDYIEVGDVEKTKIVNVHFKI
jgi:hypothetical protein